MQISQTLSAVGRSNWLPVRKGESFTYSADLSASFDGVLRLQRTLDGGQTWQTVATIAEDISSATVYDAHGHYSFFVTLGAEVTLTGSAAIILADVAEVEEVEDLKDNNGTAVLKIFEGGIEIPGEIRTTVGVGAKNGATVTAVEHGDGVIHKTVLTCTATPLTFGDEAGQGQFGGVKVYDFPLGLICCLGAVINGSITLTAPAIDTWNGDIGLGVTVPLDHQDAVNLTGAIMPKVATTQAVSKVAVTDAVSVATALTESGARWLDGTGTAKDLYLNLLIDDNAAHDNTITGTFTGTITLTWMNLGAL